MTASTRLLPTPVSARAKLLLGENDKSVVVVDGDQAWQYFLGSARRAPERAVRWLFAEPIPKVHVLSPNRRWLDPRDPDWADTLVPATLAERMTLAEPMTLATTGDLPRAVHAHRDGEVAVTAPGMLAILDHPSRSCRHFDLGADVSYAVNDLLRVVEDLCFLDDGRLATVGLGTVRMWNVHALCEAASTLSGPWSAATIVLSAMGLAVRGNQVVGGVAPVPRFRAGAAVCAGRHRVVMAIADPNIARIAAIAVDDLRTGARETEFAVFGAALAVLAALGDGDRLLAFASGRQVTVVDLDTERSHSRALASKPTALAFFEGRSCVIGDTSGRLQSFGWLGAFAPHDETVQISASPITALAAAGSRFAIATGDGKIHTWSPGDAAPAQLTGLPAATSRLAFSPDGALLA
ncbi:MAG: hypothetical protein ACRENC_12420, partial [Gemmatimonadaceae bacterium]